jgi:hypothetical protein
MNFEILEVRGEVYITTHENMGEGDWFIRGDEIHRCFRVHKTDIEFLTSIDSVYTESNTFWNKEYCKKIILTTNKDLITNGVQKIDEESLEYLKQNKNCENVKVDLVAVNQFGFEVLVTSYGFDRFIYKIIIPKEESKQEKMNKKEYIWHKEFVTYQIAIDIKSIGFNEPCFAHFVKHYNEIKCILNSDDFDGWWTNNSDNLQVKAPLYQQAFRWFREEHNLYPSINIYNDKWLCIIKSIVSNEEHISGYVIDTINKGYPIFKTYEEAELECLVKLIDIVKKQNLKG